MRTLRRGDPSTPLRSAQDDIRRDEMTQARMDWKHMVLEVSGHANYAPKGQDIVCAAVSILTQALANALADVDVKYGMARMEMQAPAEGQMKISARVCWANLSMIRSYFEVAVTGLRMLAEKYPEYIKLEEV